MADPQRELNEAQSLTLQTYKWNKGKKRFEANGLTPFQFPKRSTNDALGVYGNPITHAVARDLIERSIELDEADERVAITFDRDVLLLLLSQANCEGVRCYFARLDDANNSRTLVLSGVDRNGKDLGAEKDYIGSSAFAKFTKERLKNLIDKLDLEHLQRIGIDLPKREVLQDWPSSQWARYASKVEEKILEEREEHSFPSNLHRNLLLYKKINQLCKRLEDKPNETGDSCHVVDTQSFPGISGKEKGASSKEDEAPELAYVNFLHSTPGMEATLYYEIGGHIREQDM